MVGHDEQTSIFSKHSGAMLIKDNGDEAEETGSSVCVAFMEGTGV